MAGQHRLKTFERELRRLDTLIGEIGVLAARQLGDALDALIRGDDALAAKIIEGDTIVDRLEAEICHLGVRLMALRQPTGCDLRQIISAYKAGNEFERIGDYAANLAKRCFILKERSPVELTQSILKMGYFAQAMTSEVVAAFVERDAGTALAVWSRDEELDRMHTALFRELLSYMIEDARNITSCTHLAFIGKNLERIGDHATNVAEMLHFLVTGTALTKSRAKRDFASFSREMPSDLEEFAALR